MVISWALRLSPRFWDHGELAWSWRWCWSFRRLVFADGGLTALGTNIFNMGVVAGFGAYGVMRALRALLPAGRVGYLVAVALASWLSVVLAAVACAAELAVSGTSPWLLVLPAMVGTHAVIGVGEALITSTLLSAVIVARPDVIPSWAGIQEGETAKGPGRKMWGAAAMGFGLALVLALFVSPLASSAPDGLEKVAEQKQFAKLADGSAVWQASVLPDYSVPGVEDERVSTSVVRLIGDSGHVRDWVLCCESTESPQGEALINFVLPRTVPFTLVERSDLIGNCLAALPPQICGP